MREAPGLVSSDAKESLRELRQENKEGEVILTGNREWKGAALQN